MPSKRNPETAWCRCCRRDRNLEFHDDKRKRPTKSVQALLDHITSSGAPVFWG